jgi:hypothetical protein
VLLSRGAQSAQNAHFPHPANSVHFSAFSPCYYQEVRKVPEGVKMPPFLKRLLFEFFTFHALRSHYFQTEALFIDLLRGQQLQYNP